MLYTSEYLPNVHVYASHVPPPAGLYRSFLTPNNATGETQGVFAGTTYPYFDSLYETWLSPVFTS
jgi:hypothetical protein